MSAQPNPREVPPSALEMVHALLAHRGAQARDAMAIDVGAHVGRFALSLVRSGLFARVIAFEPNPENLEPLAALAKEDPRLAVVQSAVSDASGQRDFHADRDSATGSLLTFDPAYSTDGPVLTRRVSVTTIDEYLAGHAFGKRVSLIKTDTQGHDLSVLRGAAATIRSHRPVVITEMIYLPLYAGQEQPGRIVEEMSGLGYELYSLFNIHATIEGRLAFADALFTPVECAMPVSQRFVQLDNHASYLAQIAELERICRERLAVIEVLDAEVKRLSPAVQR